jgi:hypothetical protein
LCPAEPNFILVVRSAAKLRVSNHAATDVGFTRHRHVKRASRIYPTCDLGPRPSRRVLRTLLRMRMMKCERAHVALHAPLMNLMVRSRVAASRTMRPGRGPRPSRRPLRGLLRMRIEIRGAHQFAPRNIPYSLVKQPSQRFARRVHVEAPAGAHFSPTFLSLAQARGDGAPRRRYILDVLARDIRHAG